MKKPIRVLQIVTQMNRAGMESRQMDIYRNIDRSLIQFDFYTCREEPGNFDDEIIALGGIIYYNKPLQIHRAVEIPGRFTNFLTVHPEYDIVHCHLNQWCGLVLLGAKRAGVSVRIAHSRTSLEKMSIKNNIKNMIKLLVNYTATHRFAVSMKAAVWLYGMRAVRKGNVEIWPNAISTKPFAFNEIVRDQVRSALELTDVFIMMHVGNLRPEKNHSFLLRVFKALLEKRPNARLLLIGADYMDGVIQEEAKNLEMKDNIHYLGVRSDVPELLQAADVFVFPSFYEGFPGAVLEAQAAGLPCLISDTITDEVCLTESLCQLSINASPETWAYEILSIPPNTKDNRLQMNESIIGAGFDITAVSKKYEKFYSDLHIEVPDK